MLKYSLLTDTCGHASWLTLGDQTFVVRTLNQTISRVLSLNASDQPRSTESTSNCVSQNKNICAGPKQSQ